jgi:PAS domain S-box-containing protein
MVHNGELGERRRGSRLRATIVAVVLVPTLGMLGGALALLAVGRASTSAERSVAHHTNVQASLQRVLGLLVDAETGVRGYAATGDRRFLPQSDRARAALPAALETFRRAATGHADDPPPGEVAALIGLARRELAELALVQRTGPAAPRAERVQAAMRGKATMDSVRDLVAGIAARDQQGIARHRADQRRLDRTAVILTIAVAALALAGGVGVATFVTRRVVRRLARVRENAYRLARDEPPLPAPGGPDDEISALDRSLVEAGTLIARQRAKLDLSLGLGGISLWELGDDGRMLDVRPPQAVTGGDLDAALGYLHADDREGIIATLASVFATGEPADFEARLAADHDQWLHTRITRVARPDGGYAAVGVSMDVTARKQAAAASRENERYAAAEAVARVEARGRHNALLISSAGEGIFAVGADGHLTSANPAAARMLGYEVSDLIGCDVHELLHHSYGNGTPYPPHLCPILATLRTGDGRRVEGEVFWRRDGTRLPIEYSAFPLTDDGRTRGVVVTFVDASKRTALRTELDAEAERLRQAIRDGELVLHYQPKIDLTTGGCEAVEALVRWQRGPRLVPPDDFIPLAEATGVVHELSEWVMTEAVRQAAAWRASDAALRVAVNLSPLSLRDDRMVEHLAATAAQAGVPPSLIEVEITESALAEDTDVLLSNLARFRAMGVRTAIDDFGTGFASLAYLKHLPVTSIKIDKSFVMNMPKDRRDQAIVAAVVYMAHSLGLKVVAEGVEEDVVVRLLGHADCDLGQGYLWSRPLPSADLERWLLARS